MNFSDIFKKSFLDGFTAADINPYTALTAMAISCCVALYIFLVYRIITKKTFYSKSFNISLASICLITSAIILTIQSSIVVSLGMVGALSIVRFRTAVKDPMDLTFLFWAIAAGIICGVGLAEIAFILCIALTVLIVILNALPVAKAPLILVVNTSDFNSENDILDTVKKYTKSYKVKSRNITKTSLDLIIELRTTDSGALVKDIIAHQAVLSASLMSHDGEVTY
ncbi:MAG: DUF4956 domain-containing protein [Clostridia bacterium]|nr:DUF4956 domain-containing protein [Clostridia bacterium]